MTVSLYHLGWHSGSPGRKGSCKSWQSLAHLPVGAVWAQPGVSARLSAAPISTAPHPRAPAASGETRTGGATPVQGLNQHRLTARCQTLSSLSDRVSWSRQTPAGSDRDSCRGRCQPPRLPLGRAARAGAQPGHRQRPARGGDTGTSISSTGSSIHLQHGDIHPSAARGHPSICNTGTSISSMVTRPGEPALPGDLINDCGAAVCGTNIQLRVAHRVDLALLLAGVTSTMKYSSRYHRSKSDDKSKGVLEGNFCVFLHYEWQFHWAGKYIWIPVRNTFIQSSRKQSEVNTTCNVIYVCYLHEFSGLIPHHIPLKLCYEDEVIPFRFLSNVPDRQILACQQSYQSK